jgi:hypothetical protein
MRTTNCIKFKVEIKEYPAKENIFERKIDDIFRTLKVRS